jgi:4-carboxymuconolactone decarboxylase
MLMRLATPRVTPITQNELTPEQREILEPSMRPGRPPVKILWTLARHPAAAKAFSTWAGYVLRGSTLPKREREIVILRIGYLCRSGYEWAQHVRIGKRAGLTDEEIARLKKGADAPGWSANDRALIRAADDLHKDQFISPATWDALSAFLSEQQRMDVVFTAAQYTQVSMILNSLGVQLDEGLVGDPDFQPRA